MSAEPNMSPEAPLAALVREHIVKGKSLAELVRLARFRRKRRVVEETTAEELVKAAREREARVCVNAAKAREVREREEAVAAESLSEVLERAREAREENPA